MAEYKYGDYKITKRARGVTITPLITNPSALPPFGLGNATFTIDPNNMPQGAIVVALNGETQNISLVPHPPYDAPKWFQIAENVEDTTREIQSPYNQSLGLPPIPISFKQGTFKKFKQVGGNFIASGFIGTKGCWPYVDRSLGW